MHYDVTVDEEEDRESHIINASTTCLYTLIFEVRVRKDTSKGINVVNFQMAMNLNSWNLFKCT